MPGRIPPSEQMRQELQALLEGTPDGREHLGKRFVRIGAQLLAQELLEEEVTDFLERGHYERRQPDQTHRGYRNGYRVLGLSTAEGEVPLHRPLLRDTQEPFESTLLEFLKGNSDVLERLVVEMYARGLSTRDIEDGLRAATGDALLSRSAVSAVTDRLWDDYEAFCERDLSGFEVEYLFVDAVYESLRRQGGLKEGLLCAWAICRDGSKVLLHLTLGNRESEANWLDFLRDLVGRGLQTPVLMVSDGAPGAIAALEAVFPRSLRQRCLRHKVQNVLSKVPDWARDRVKRAIKAAYQAPNQEVAELIGTKVLEEFGEEFPSAMKSFRSDWEACLAYLRCPAVHHRRIRTTNLMERGFGEERRRTKVIPRFFTEKSCLKLAWVSLWQASQRWRGVRMTDFEIQQLRALRRELGIPPSPGGGRAREMDETATGREQAA